MIHELNIYYYIENLDKYTMGPREVLHKGSRDRAYGPESKLKFYFSTIKINTNVYDV